MVLAVLARLGGAASWRALRDADISWYALWRAVRSGEAVRLREGAYALRNADAGMTAVVALGGVLACTSAAVALGLPVLVEHGVHVIVPRSWRHAIRAGVHVHRRDLDDQERVGTTTSLLRTVLDCARELPLREALVICDAALRRGLDLSALREAALAARGPGSAAIRTVVSLADGTAESPIESCLRLLLQGLGTVRSQVWIDGVGRVDFLLDGWLVVEADGFEHHSSRESYRTDRRRNNALAALGYVVLRFSYEDVVHHDQRVVDVVSRVLAQRAA